MKRGLSALAAVSVLVLAGAGSALAGDGLKNVGPDYNHGKAKKYNAVENDPNIQFAAPKGPAKLGDQKVWPADDDINGVYLKYYTLRGAGDHIEVWVANNLKFPGSDCRNAFVQITDQQVQSLVTEFDTNIYPKESVAFSVPAKRQGEGGKDLAKSLRGALPGMVPASYYVGNGEDIVVLVDNVRDANFYAPSTPAGQTYIGGFFWSYLNDLVDRNVMTIDAYDWVHRTGATPPDDRGHTGCALVSGLPKPHNYEATFAHEYQHLLEHYSDPDEVSWINEGLSDWAQSLVGYVDTNIPHDTIGADSHIGCFEGWQGEAFGGAENSLTLWGDQGDPEILCDYGAAYSFMQYLYGRYGTAFMSALHHASGNGIAGLQQTLDGQLTGANALQVIHEWAATMALDDVAAAPAVYHSPTLFSEINWDNSQSYSSPGAPENGSDYVRLRNSTGYLNGSSVSTFTFTGAKTLIPRPVLWTTDGDALYSGTGDLFDRAIVRSASVPSAGDASLTFQTRYNLEANWDFGVVQVSADGGKTYTSLPCPGTTTTVDPAGHPTVKANVPGFTGVQDWTTVTCDLSAYRGSSVLVAFRDITDWASAGNPGASFPSGWWVKGIQVAGVALGDDSLAGWQSPTQVRPYANPGTFTVQLVSYASNGSVAKVATVPLDANNSVSLGGAALQGLIAPGADVVAAIVTLDEPSETAIDYAGYTLVVNGVTQPGGF